MTKPSTIPDIYPIRPPKNRSHKRNENLYTRVAKPAPGHRYGGVSMIRKLVWPTRPIAKPVRGHRNGGVPISKNIQRFYQNYGVGTRTHLFIVSVFFHRYRNGSTETLRLAWRWKSMAYGPIRTCSQQLQISMCLLLLAKCNCKSGLRIGPVRHTREKHFKRKEHIFWYWETKIHIRKFGSAIFGNLWRNQWLAFPEMS